MSDSDSDSDSEFPTFSTASSPVANENSIPSQFFDFKRSLLGNIGESEKKNILKNMRELIKKNLSDAEKKPFLDYIINDVRKENDTNFDHFCYNNTKTGDGEIVMKVYIISMVSINKTTKE
jgi:hypothetical protein